MSYMPFKIRTYRYVGESYIERSFRLPGAAFFCWLTDCLLRTGLFGLPALPVLYSRVMTERLRGRAGVARRARWLSAHPLCVHCLALKPARYTPATVVDHVVALVNGGADDESNFQSLCDDDHRKKTASDLGYKPRYGADKGGWPQDPNHHWNKA